MSVIDVFYLRDKSIYVCVYIVQGGWHCISKEEASYRWGDECQGGW